MNSLKSFLDASAAQHKQLCPRQVLGIRMGMLAGKLLNIDLPQTQKRLLVIVETDGCFVDGIQASTGCTVGHRTLRVKDFGKVGAVFVDTSTNKTIRLSPKENIRKLANDIGLGGKNQWEKMLIGYQHISDNELFDIEEVELVTPIKSLVSQPGIREICSHCGEEIINQREVLKQGDIYCQTCAGNAYYRRE